MQQVDVWLRGPVEGVPPLLMPAAHALLQAVEDVERETGSFSADELWLRPGGAASVGFHLRHIAGVVDRLLTYARGDALTAEQFANMSGEREPGEPVTTADELIGNLRSTVDRALTQLRSTSAEELLDPREVGRKKMPSNVLGLVFHAAEHAQRHTGQVVATAKIIRGVPLLASAEPPASGT